MDNTINGRTPEEIKRGLACCLAKVSPVYIKCDPCPYQGVKECINRKNSDVLALIQQLEHSWDELFETAKQLERERDAAVEAVGKLADNCDRSIACEYCEFRDYQCIVCEFKWRGVQEVE